MYLITLGGMFLGCILFMFTFIASKRSGKYYLAPIITFLFSVVIVVYSLIVVGGFEGMGYLFLAAGFLIISIAGTLFLPFLIRRKASQQFKKRDKISLVMLPIIFFATIGLVIFSEQGYWIIDKGEHNYVRGEGIENYYRVSTISEGKKQVSLRVGEEYMGKEIEVENITKRGPTEITVKMVEGEDENKIPYIDIGVDEITEPVKVQTTNGVVFESAKDKAGN
ncbi:hypothetical protein Len3610_16925 [Lentibacillus sp. CBA3610]|nr:hypothetical protein Len3610_16925 [Lentibacillus sp. CBA3610]